MAFGGGGGEPTLLGENKSFLGLLQAPRFSHDLGGGGFEYKPMLDRWNPITLGSLTFLGRWVL
jgi:hypothetical protein